MRNRSAPLGTITIDSPLKPAEVIQNLTVRGREWRASAVPEDLRKLKVSNLVVETNGSQFRMFWPGPVSPLYNPSCYGVVQPYGDGSRIRAGFKVFLKDSTSLFAFAALLILSLFGQQTVFKWILESAMAIVLIRFLVPNRNGEYLSARLVDVLTDAAQARPPVAQPFSTTMSTNGP